MPIKTKLPREQSCSWELVDIDMPLTCILYKLVCSTNNIVILSVQNILKYSIGHNSSKFSGGLLNPSPLNTFPLWLALLSSYADNSRCCCCFNVDFWWRVNFTWYSMHFLIIIVHGLSSCLFAAAFQFRWFCNVWLFIFIVHQHYVCYAVLVPYQLVLQLLLLRFYCKHFNQP